MNGNSTAPTYNDPFPHGTCQEPPQKKKPVVDVISEVFEVLDDDNHSTTLVQGYQFRDPMFNICTNRQDRGYMQGSDELTSLGEEWRKVMVPSPSSSDLETIVKACSNDDELLKKVNKFAIWRVRISIDLDGSADPDFPNHGLVCIPQYFGVNAEPLAYPNKRPFSPLALMQQSINSTGSVLNDTPNVNDRPATEPLRGRRPRKVGS
ncbi:hypothetical protein Tco_0335035 [Tanacetum coccineum]